MGQKCKQFFKWCLQIGSKKTTEDADIKMWNCFQTWFEVDLHDLKADNTAMTHIDDEYDSRVIGDDDDNDVCISWI